MADLLEAVFAFSPFTPTLGGNISSMKKVALKGLGMALLIGFASCAKPKGIEYVDLANLQIGTKNFATPVVSAELRFYNPNNFRMNLRRAEMDLSINNNFVGHSLLDSLIEIPKMDTFSIPVKLDLDLKTVISNSIGALLSNEVDLTIKGTAKLGKAGVYKNFPFTYQGKQKLNLFR
ncbi:MAG: LEA type 2 family protein [Chitinophagaceae bacterium]